MLEFSIPNSCGSWDSVVNVETCYGLDGLGISCSLYRLVLEKTVGGFDIIDTETCYELDGLGI
jgi:hypothetical protein